MTPFGYIFFLAGAFLIRQTVVGRAKDIPGDTKDAATALLSANWSEFSSVLARRGENVSVEPTSSSGDGSTDTFNPVSDLAASLLGGNYAATVVALGKAAKGYALGGTGPSYYDCSGLLWKAAYKLKMYTGPRFTTRSFTSIASQWTTQVDSPIVGDIVLWKGQHMGVCVGEDKMYSARSPEKGINYSSISGDSSYFGTSPTFWRING